MILCFMIRVATREVVLRGPLTAVTDGCLFTFFLSSVEFSRKSSVSWLP